MNRPEVKEFVDELRTEWKDLWESRVDDKIRAEGVAKHDYSKLFVEQGTVIMATRDFKPIEFHDIVETHLGCESSKAGAPNPTVGGWGKFIKTNIQTQRKGPTKRAPPPKPKPQKGQHQKEAEEAGNALNCFQFNKFCN